MIPAEEREWQVTVTVGVWVTAVDQDEAERKALKRDWDDEEVLEIVDVTEAT